MDDGNYVIMININDQADYWSLMDDKFGDFIVIINANELLLGGAITILKKYKFVNRKDDILYMKWNIKHVWNHQLGFIFEYIYRVPNLVSIQSTCAFSICMLLSICLCIYLPTSIHLASYQAQSMGICGSLHLLIHSQQGIQQTKWTGGQKKAERFKMVQSNAAKIHVGLISSHLAS